MLRISSSLTLPEREIELTAVRSQGAGGQNVNKVSSAIHLRFDIGNSSLPEACKARLLTMNDSRITKEGVLVIKAQQHRTQEKNKADALERLREMILAASRVPKSRVATKPTASSRHKRLEEKGRRSAIKNMRGRITD